MNHEIICGWLGLSPDVWPPDHYRLLGLEPGADDVALIEQRVHQRLDLIRGYQMIHPEQATEAMNRLAQAFVCLTEQAMKTAYDRSLLGDRVQPASPPPLPVVPAAAPAAPRRTLAAAAPRDPLVWMYTPGDAGPGSEVPPPPVRAALPSAPTVTPPPLPPLPAEQDTPAPPTAPIEPPPEPVDPMVEAAQTSPQARRGLATRRALYRRVARTRELLRLWHRAGKHLEKPEKALGKQEASELYKLVKELEDALEDFPLLGEAGQPGYLIVNLLTYDKARDLQGLTLSQRESLNRDWQAGRKFLEAHRDYLREVLHEHQQRGWGERLIRIVRAYLNEQPWAALLVVVALAAIAVALWRTHR
jgi:hypothetical protein